MIGMVFSLFACYLAGKAGASLGRGNLPVASTVAMSVPSSIIMNHQSICSLILLYFATATRLGHSKLFSDYQVGFSFTVAIVLFHRRSLNLHHGVDPIYIRTRVSKQLRNMAFPVTRYFLYRLYRESTWAK